LRAARKLRTPCLWGELYLPSGDQDKLAAVVILSSSAGVCDIRERYYAGFFASRGVAALAVDSFGPRGITETITDQSRLAEDAMEKDAYAAFALLCAEERVDCRKIALMGVSLGGLAVLRTALTVRRRMFARPERDFAARAALVPPCHIQQRDARTDGRPLLVLLAEEDDYTGVVQPLMYVRRMREAGPADIVLRVYPGAGHCWELAGRPVFLEAAENYSGCLWWQEDDGRLTEADSGRSMAQEEFVLRRREFCALGAHAGGGGREIKQRAAEDILAFLEERAGFSGAVLGRERT
jgi:dienelactone hydrolase